MCVYEEPKTPSVSTHARLHRIRVCCCTHACVCCNTFPFVTSPFPLMTAAGGAGHSGACTAEPARLYAVRTRSPSWCSSRRSPWFVTPAKATESRGRKGSKGEKVCFLVCVCMFVCVVRVFACMCVRVCLCCAFACVSKQSTPKLLSRDICGAGFAAILFHR